MKHTQNQNKANQNRKSKLKLDIEKLKSDSLIKRPERYDSIKNKTIK